MVRNTGCGTFSWRAPCSGTIDKADAASRVAWTRAVRQEAEKRGIPWAYWDDGASFEIYDPKARTWNGELMGALFR
ncbi:MAG: hypothetical protein ACLQVI_24120 [Polyangiaceae bacterium]